MVALEIAHEARAGDRRLHERGKCGRLYARKRVLGKGWGWGGNEMRR